MYGDCTLSQPWSVTGKLYACAFPCPLVPTRPGGTFGSSGCSQLSSGASGTNTILQADQNRSYNKFSIPKGGLILRHSDIAVINRDLGKT
jgi:hypothetical protein